MDSCSARRFVLKRRRWYAPAVIFAGNTYIRILGLHIRVLQNREWLRREADLYRRLYAEQVAVRPGGWMEVPCIGGDLAVYLANPAHSSASKMEALRCATRELLRIHAITVEEGGTSRTFSHGDAGVRNVAYAPNEGRAHWFDFEVVHASECSDEWRQADDLRALLFSALACLPESLARNAIDVVLRAYPKEPVLKALLERIASGILDVDTYHLAQLQIAPALHARLVALLSRRLTQITQNQPNERSASRVASR
jgi:hypothetical protein